jgi:hypothetical protein
MLTVIQLIYYALPNKQGCNSQTKIGINQEKDNLHLVIQCQ